MNGIGAFFHPRWDNLYSVHVVTAHHSLPPLLSVGVYPSPGHHHSAAGLPVGQVVGLLAPLAALPEPEQEPLQADGVAAAAEQRPRHARLPNLGADRLQAEDAEARGLDTRVTVM